MKWVTIISCLFLISFAESKHLYRAYRDAEHLDTIKRASELSAENLASFCTVVYSQILQKAPFEEVKKLKVDTIELSKKCAADEHSDPECTKHLHTVILDEICHEEGIAEKYGFAACCAKTDPERHDCFLAHKNGSKEYLPPFQKPEPEEACKHFHDNKQEFLLQYIYEYARRNPYTNIFTFIKGAHDYEKAFTTCCQAEDKRACLAEKASAAAKKIKEEIILGKHICSILKKYGKRDLLSLKFAALSQRFPRAQFDVIKKLANDAVEAQEECCLGDTLDCSLDRDKLAKYICAHQDTISTKLKECCESSALERTDCIIHAANDDKPEELTPKATEFLEAAACQHYSDNKDLHLGRFLYENSRRHPELSPVTLKKNLNIYKHLLETCCGKEHPETCLATLEEQIKTYIAAIKEVTKKNCDQLKQLGPYLFRNELIFRYGPKAPQLSTEDLLELTRRLVEVGNECCHKDEPQREACAVNHADVALGFLCYRHEQHHINKQVCKCCSDPYPDRRECISELGPDPEYVPGPLNVEAVTFHENYCTISKPEQEKKKHSVLFELIKYKPHVNAEQLAAVTVNAAEFLAKCCAEENEEKIKECFGKQTEELIEKTKTILGEH